MKKHRIILGIVAAVVILPPLVILAILCAHISYTSSVEFDKCYGYIEDIFELCDSENRFNVTRAKFQGHYMYDVDVDLRDISSEQELFDKIVSFVSMINEQVMSDEESELFSQGYYFGFNEYVLGKHCLLSLWVDPSSDIKGFSCDTNIYADYSALNPIAEILGNSYMLLDYDDFTEEQIQSIKSQKNDYLFRVELG